MSSSVIVYASRTAIGRMSGALASIPAPQLGAVLVKDAISRPELKGLLPDEIIMGQVLTAGVGQAPARQTAIYGGLPPSVKATTINKVCGSGLKAVMLADQAIRAGDAQIIFAGGQENMSLAPHLLPNSRTGYRFGSFEVLDHMQWDGLRDPYEGVAMGQCGELCAKTHALTREAQDTFALESYRRSREAITNGSFRDEIVPVEIKSKQGSSLFAQDEEPFSSDLGKLPLLRPAFAKDGTITAGNASSINDGAALLVVMDEKEARTRGIPILARIISHLSYAGEPSWFTTAPVYGIQKLLEKTQLKVADIDLFEINEAFSVVPMMAIKELKLSPQQVNPLGGAVSLGHPIGASGARVLTTLIHQLRRSGGRRGIASLCIGGGESSSLMIEMA